MHIQIIANKVIPYTNFVSLATEVLIHNKHTNYTTTNHNDKEIDYSRDPLVLMAEKPY